ncbi:MRG/MORF4L-binding protein [Varanus komodoensis]|nr:MRG/MORF4L-binding protein [Varanus komodoensis]
MICIRDKFSQNIGRQISSKVIWDHLSTMYDMQALHESEILPFPNSEKNFILPEEIIQEVKEGKVMIEDDVKEEIKEEMESHAGPEDDDEEEEEEEEEEGGQLEEDPGRKNSEAANPPAETEEAKPQEKPGRRSPGPKRASGFQVRVPDLRRSR